tara:strand:- start:92 stop:778 length:687 start_codon:yes stop_codon:yes gene_type:complete
MNENKTSKYFKYAIGEIVLVVIGILIALQINNWNENRKTKVEAEIFVAKIINDLAIDTLNINKLIKRSNESDNEISKFFNYYDSLTPNKKNIDLLLDSIKKVSAYYMKYFPVNHTYKNMENSKNGDLLKIDQRDALISLVAEQEELNIIIDNSLNNAIDERKLSKHYLGFSDDFYEKINIKNSTSRKTQTLLHSTLYLKALSKLYYYIELRGVQIKKSSKSAIELLQN